MALYAKISSRPYHTEGVMKDLEEAEEKLKHWVACCVYGPDGEWKPHAMHFVHVKLDEVYSSLLIQPSACEVWEYRIVVELAEKFLKEFPGNHQFDFDELRDRVVRESETIVYIVERNLPLGAHRHARINMMICRDSVFRLNELLRRPRL